MQKEGESLTNHKSVRGLVVNRAAGSCANVRNEADFFFSEKELILKPTNFF